MTGWLFSRAYDKKKYYAKKREQILAREDRYHIENAEILKSRRGGMKTTGEGSQAAREPIVNRTRNKSEITEDNNVLTTGTNQQILEMLKCQE